MTMLLFMMFMLFILFEPGLRDGLGAAMSFLLSPSIGFGGTLPVISVMLAGTLTGLISTGLRVWTTDFVEMERTRLLQKSFSRQMNDARLRRDTDKMNKLRRAQPHVMSKQMEVQAATMRPAMGTMLLAIAVFWWLGAFISTEVAYTCASLPWTSCWPLDASFGPIPYWVALYSIMSLPLILAFSAALKLLRLRTLDPASIEEKPMPSIEDLMEKAEEEQEDEAVVEEAADRARERLGGSSGTAAALADDADAYDDGRVRIVEDDDVVIVDPAKRRKGRAEEE
jgi:uncharacterized membrane protein (DUF106 family)